MIIEIIFGGLGLCGLGYGIYKSYTVHKVNIKIDQENQKFLEIQSELLNQKNLLNKEINQLNSDIQNRKLKKKELDERLLNDTQSYSLLLETNKKISREAMEEYQKTLEQRYNEIECEFDSDVQTMKDSYAKLQDELMREMAEESAKLDKIRATRTAAQDALIREQEIKEKQEFYGIQLTKGDLNDIDALINIKPLLHKPRILSMLIWQTFFQKPLKELSARVLGTTSTVCGIYKITNQLNDKCYIGQSVDVAKRWAEHAKCGLGIDTPQGNKLYAAMQHDGLWNFSWELLEECPREQLNEKEKFYIEMYMANDFGYNSTKGNK